MVFFVPVIKDWCIKCGKCDKVCPALHFNPGKKDIIGYYGYTKDDKIRSESSSGGAFSAIADDFLKNGGIVFGAVIDKGIVEHRDTKSTDILLMRKSKYVFCSPADSFRKIKDYLKNDEKVLFCGTPCQIAGLKNYLGEHDKLLTIDFICHGVPSQKAFFEYLSYLEKKYKSTIEEIDFRPKSINWSLKALSIKFKNGKKYFKRNDCDYYYTAFYDNTMLMKSCYSCKYASIHVSDITLGDFWGIYKYDKTKLDEKGLSLILCNTEKGHSAVNSLNDFVLNPLQYKDFCYSIQERNVPMDKRNEFMEYAIKIDFVKALKKYYKYNILLGNIKTKVKKIIKKRKA